MTLAYLGLGSNLGDREAHLRRGVLHLERRAVRMVALSAVYETTPWGYSAQPPFLNMVACVQTSLDPFGLLDTCLAIEEEEGRTRPFPNAPRTLDIDILLYGERIIASPRLVVPHPRLADRAFVLVPLCDLAPDLVHPVLGISLRTLAERTGAQGIRRWAPPPHWQGPCPPQG
ncbi:Bifunctional folate synthesis protein [bacterium HR23]|nr:Bifunctional folate synthesis protein [bacterium HR23]